MPPTAPSVLSGRYELHEALGSGGMATVYRGTDLVLGRTVAVKVLAPRFADDPAFVERFRREARAAARLNHPAVARIFDTGSDGETHFIVMEHVPGTTLAEVIDARGRFAPERAAAIVGAVADALSAAHAEGIVHRDVKPGNVMVTPEGAVRVMDFGIARAVDGSDTLTRTSRVFGTATYLSPEQARGEKVDARSDVYSLGVVLYELLTGRPPFSGESSIVVASKHLGEEPEPPRRVDPSIPAGLEAVAMRAMAKDPDERYQSAGELRSALEAWGGGSTGATTEPLALAATEVLPRSRRRARVPLLARFAAGAVAVGAIVAIALVASRSGSLPAPGGHHRAASPTVSSPAPTTPAPTPTTPTFAQADAAMRNLLAQGVQAGKIDPKAADDLSHRLDDLEKAVADGNVDDAGHKLSDIQKKLSEDIDHGQIGPPYAPHLLQAVRALAAALGVSVEEKD